MNQNKLFMVKGERCSGTTYLSNLLIHNLNIKVYKYQCWKHGYLQLNSLDDMAYEQFNVPTIFIFRDVFDWLRSFYLMPHHLEGAYSGRWIKNISFSEFLRREVKNFDDNNNERMLDKHPFHLRDPKNMLELRKWKIEHWLNYRTTGRPTYYLKYEDLRENPEKIIREINNLYFNVEFQFRNWTLYKSNQQKIYQPKQYFNISDDDYQFILDNVDWDLENKIGYKKYA